MLARVTDIGVVLTACVAVATAHLSHQAGSGLGIAVVVLEGIVSVSLAICAAGLTFVIAGQRHRLPVVVVWLVWGLLALGCIRFWWLFPVLGSGLVLLSRKHRLHAFTATLCVCYFGSGANYSWVSGPAYREQAAESSPSFRERLDEALVESSTGEGWLVGQTSETCLVIVSVDTLRADLVENYIKRPDLGPGWMAYLLTASQWTEARSQSTWTLPALASLQTGLSPTEHLAGRPHDGDFRQVSGLSEGVETLAEHLTKEGYATAAIVANPYIRRSSGLARGFQYFDNRTFSGTTLHGVQTTFLGQLLLEPLVRARSPHVVSMLAHAADLSDELQGTQHYLWVHLLDAHAPYVEGDKEHPDRWACPTPGASRCVHPKRGGFVEEPHDEIAAMYLKHATRVLDEIGTFWARLSASGALARCTTLFTADHGEELGEYGRFGHGHDFTDAQMRVPLLISAPGSAARVRTESIFLSDVAHLVSPVSLPRSERIAGGVPLVGTLTPTDPVGLWTMEGRAVLSATGATWWESAGADHGNHGSVSDAQSVALQELRQALEPDSSSEAFLVELGYLSP